MILLVPSAVLLHYTAACVYSHCSGTAVRGGSLLPCDANVSMYCVVLYTMYTTVTIHTELQQQT
jgi:hypothetical protein